jgi:hypothetical protein
MGTMNNKNVLCISSENKDPDIRCACQELALHLLKNKYRIVTTRRSPFLPDNSEAYKNQISFIEDIKPFQKHYMKAKEAGVNFGTIHGNAGRELVKQIAAACESITILTWPSSTPAPVEQYLFPIIKTVASKNKIPMFNLANPTVFDRLYRQT